MAINLTEGFIPMLYTTDAPMMDAKPVLQIADVRLVNTQQQNSGERYRVLLSDGCYLQQGMLGTQRNELVKSGFLQKGSIVQLKEFVCNSIQGRLIIIILNLDVIHEKFDSIGDPKQYVQSATAAPTITRTVTPPIQSSVDHHQSGASGYLQSTFNRANSAGGSPLQHPVGNYGGNSSAQVSSFASDPYAGQQSPYMKMESGARVPGPYVSPRSEVSHPTSNSYSRPSYQQSPPMYMNRGPIAKNDAPPRIVPISALNPYQGRWTIKARITAKSELRHYNNPRGDGKVFSFDLLDSDGGEIRVTCFNAVADQFFDVIEPGKVYLISKGNLKPAQKNFNHLRNDYEIFLESGSTVQLCTEDDTAIPHQQFNFLPISNIEALDSGTVVDVIGIVSFISPSTSIMRKNGTDALKRSLHLKDMSNRSVELTLWGNFCNSEGQMLQNICDSGISPVLAIKSARVYEFNGKAIGTIGSSQLFIDPEFPEALALRNWFEKGGRNMPSVSISRDVAAIGNTNSRKVICQIKDEQLGTSEKPDWISVSATISFIKTDTFCYMACPNMTGERKCSKKVINNGDGKWMCDKCDLSFDECDYRYILSFQIQDHTGLTWVTGFQECGEEIIGIPAKDLYYMKYEGQQDDQFSEILRRVLFSKFMFKLKVKEETFNDEQRVKSTVVKAEKLDFPTETKFLLEAMGKSREDYIAPNPGIMSPSTGGFSNTGIRPHVPNYMGKTSGGNVGMSQFGIRPPSDAYVCCNNCGGRGHGSELCPSTKSGLCSGGGYMGRMGSSGANGGWN